MLTREQLLGSPDDCYMNQDQLAFFRALLLQEKNELEESLRIGHEDLLAEEHVSDPADRASLEEARIASLRTHQRETNQIHRIEAALSRIDKDEYGYCHETGEPIGLERLLVRPTTTLSYEAQSRKESKERQYA